MKGKIQLFAFGIVLFSQMGMAGTAQTFGQTVSKNSNPSANYTYNYMYPYMNNQMRKDLNPGTTKSAQQLSPINAVVKTTDLPKQAPTQKRIVQRSGSTQNNNRTKSRNIVSRNANNSNSALARSATSGNYQTSMSSSRLNNTNTSNTISNKRIVGRSSRTGTLNSTSTSTSVTNTSTSRCLADYIECMDGYCERSNTAYNRCFCSSKLSQIDYKYQDNIDKLIKQIITLQGVGDIDENELMTYWNEVVGQYTGDNAFIALDDALNIDWSTLESRTNGQNAFATGHEYCIQHLSGCFYAASNLRDVYRSNISQDCATYENKLKAIQNAAEDIIKIYK